MGVHTLPFIIYIYRYRIQTMNFRQDCHDSAKANTHNNDTERSRGADGGRGAADGELPETSTCMWLCLTNRSPALHRQRHRRALPPTPTNVSPTLHQVFEFT